MTECFKKIGDNDNHHFGIFLLFNWGCPFRQIMHQNGIMVTCLRWWYPLPRRGWGVCPFIGGKKATPVRVGHPAHLIYPYLLRELAINRPNHVWCADITYIPVQRGFLYLVAIMDWATRNILAWRLSNSMDAAFRVEALNAALSKYGKPRIFTTDQGSQFTSFDFTGVLKDAEVTISMDGRGRCMDNIFIERLWRSLKYEAVYLHELTGGFKAERVYAAVTN